MSLNLLQSKRLLQPSSSVTLVQVCATMPAIGLLTIDLRIPGARSLKDKRRVLSSAKDRLRKLNLSLSETDKQDAHQHAQLSVVSVATDRQGVDRIFSSAITELERKQPGIILQTQIDWL